MHDSNPDHTESPWWLHPGSAQCAFCAVAYHEESEVYCVLCDRAICPACALQMAGTLEVICPDCHRTHET